MKKLIVLAMGMLFATVASAASISIVDSFTLAQTSATGTKITSTGSVVTSNLQALGTGYDRQSEVDQATGTGEASLNMLGSGYWDYSSDVRTTGSATTTYTKTGGGTIDASSLLGYIFVLTLDYSDQVAGSIELQVTDADGTVLSTSLPITSNVSGTIYSALLSSFTQTTAGTTAGLDMSALTSVSFGVVGDSSQDVTFSEFKFQTVPEPGTYALLGLGLAGLAFLKRRR